MRSTYRGSCHCGRIRFEVELDLDHVRSCDCSICRRRGALIHRVEDAALKILSSLDGLTLYEWGRRTAKDYFCPVCGILPFRRPGQPTPAEVSEGVHEFLGWAVNVRCLEGVDLDSLPVRQILGSRL